MGFNADGAPSDVLGINLAPLAMPNSRIGAALSISLVAEKQKEEERRPSEVGHAESINFI